jgi:hypothetical protein
MSLKMPLLVKWHNLRENNGVHLGNEMSYYIPTVTIRNGVPAVDYKFYYFDHISNAVWRVTRAVSNDDVYRVIWNVINNAIIDSISYFEEMK